MPPRSPTGPRPKATYPILTNGQQDQAPYCLTADISSPTAIRLPKRALSGHAIRLGARHSNQTSSDVGSAIAGVRPDKDFHRNGGEV